MLASVDGPDRRAATRGGATYGVFAVGSLRLAVPLESLREVLPCPHRLEALPDRTPGVLGAINLRGTMIPVLDPCSLLARSEPHAREAAVVVVLMPRDRLFGLLVSEVRGVTSVATEQLQHVSAVAGEPPLFTQAFERAEDGLLTSVLDVEALARVAAVPLVRPAQASAEPRAVALDGAPRRSLLLLRCGSLRLCIDAMLVQATRPQPVLRASALQGRVCRGVLDHGDVSVPAIDPLEYLGMGSLPPEQACQILVLRIGGGLVAVQLTEVIDIVRVAATDLAPMPALPGARLSRVSGLLRAGGHQYLCLDGAALSADPDIVGLSTLNVHRDTQAGGAPVPRLERTRSGPIAATLEPDGRRRALLLYSAGMEAATDLACVKTVVAFPADFVALHAPGRDGDALLGLFLHEGEAVPLVCLTTLLGRPQQPAADTARVLVVDAGPRRVGFAVSRLHAIEHAAVELELSGQLVSDRAGAVPGGAARGRRPMVEIGIGPGRRVMPLHDLPALARGLGLAGEAPAADRAAA